MEDGQEGSLTEMSSGLSPEGQLPRQRIEEKVSELRAASRKVLRYETVAQRFPV